MTRTRFLLAIPAAVAAFFARPKPALASGSEILRSFDARDWAKHFVEHVKQIPGIATDEGTMATWFANALMRGYDERDMHHARNHDKAATIAGSDYLQELRTESIRGAVARGWCADECASKEMDCVLAEAITQEILKLKA